MKTIIENIKIKKVYIACLPCCKEIDVTDLYYGNSLQQDNECCKDACRLILNEKNELVQVIK
jgi:hypothetical protein